MTQLPGGQPETRGTLSQNLKGRKKEGDVSREWREGSSGN